MTYNFERKGNCANISQGALGGYGEICGSGDYLGDSRRYERLQDYGGPKDYVKKEYVNEVNLIHRL